MDQKTILRIAAVISGISGIIILAGVIYPIVSYNSTYSKNYTKLISPVTNTKNDVQGVNTNTNPTSTTADYTQASSWFVGGAAKSDFNLSKVDYYTVSIPKLKINDAQVAIGGEDLSHSLIQYPGTALP